MQPYWLNRLGAFAAAALAGLTLTTAASRAADSEGMFGIHMGEDIAALTVGGVIEPHLYRLLVVDQPNRFFPYYQVRHHPATGVCMVAGVTPIIIDSGPAEELHRYFDEIKQALEAEYGKTKTIDRVIPNNQGEWRRHFMNFLKDDKAILAARWSYNQGHDLGQEKREILLVADGVSSSQAAIILQVKFNNYVECIRAMQREGDNAESEMREPRTVRVFRGNQEPEPSKAAESADTSDKEAATDVAESSEAEQPTEPDEGETPPPF